jgi:Flp pilus assembly protein TadG
MKEESFRARYRAVARRLIARHGARRTLAQCQSGTAALEFALLMTPLLMLLFGYIATASVFFTWSTMQSNAQYAALLVATGQIKSFNNGAISSSNSTATTTCSGSLTSAVAEYYACTGLPSWVPVTVTATENCTVPSVTVSLSASASAAAIANIYNYFTGQSLVAQAVVMKEGQCP